MKRCHIAITLPIKLPFHWINDQSIHLPITSHPQIHISIHPSWHSVAASTQNLRHIDPSIFPICHGSRCPCWISPHGILEQHTEVTKEERKRWVARLRLERREKSEMKAASTLLRFCSEMAFLNWNHLRPDKHFGSVSILIQLKTFIPRPFTYTGPVHTNVNRSG